MKKLLVAYFSASGTTAQVAKTLAKAIQADLHEIKPKIPYTTEDLDWTNKESRSSIEMHTPKSRPEIANKVTQMADYDVIFLGFPIWWYVAPTLVNTFLEQYDLSGKTIVVFATSGGSGFGETLQHLKESVSTSTLLREGKIFNRSVPEVQLKAWVDSLNL